MKSDLTVDGAESNIICRAHNHSHSSGKKLTQMSLDAFANHSNLLVSVDLSMNLLESLLDEFFASFSVIQNLNLSHNQLKSLPDGMGICQQLTSIDVSHNSLKKLPADFKAVMSSLKLLNISNNPFENIPEAIWSATLEELHASSIGLKELPSEIGQMVNLMVLKIGENQLKKLPPSFSELSKLKELDLSGVRWIETSDTKMLLTQKAFDEFMTENPCTASIEKKVFYFPEIVLKFSVELFSE